MLNFLFSGRIFYLIPGRKQARIRTDEQMAEMAASCARACGGAKGSAKVLHQSDMEAIYKMLK